MKYPTFALLAVCGALTTAPAQAGEPSFGALALTPAPSAKSDPTQTPFSPRLLPAPQLSETRVVRLPDGSTRIVCDEVPNPRYEKVRLQLKQAREQQR
ncbi:hypothetical protein [Tahibacter harae]|uniref:Uncharacterized protein n=1 Tax=Tahibacter harae TaxID=2963937 RepID=A0ABT1QY24_9GAMM|nr:hypothetical protein [Tahibacter harae]MCQ4167178.1 hypothetical protein [Tahibacter harae]